MENKNAATGVRRLTRGALFLWLCGGLAGMAQAALVYVGSDQIRPPAALREFRGLWIATVKDLDWPSRPGLTALQQKAELVLFLDQAQLFHFNAVFLQVRPSCDALYASKLEPWSEYLTGQMGRAPEPFYDPLAFAVEEAHRRGLELHAWFNPYRARHASAISAVSRDHISKTRPYLVRSYGKSLWLDPGEREVQEYSLSVIQDVVRRYDIDGVHFDDYFYPYPEKDSNGRVLPFPDGATWKRYQDHGGKLSRDDWRRESVNLLILRVGQSIRTLKPWVKFGIAPFGIWRPAYPSPIKGLDAYEVLYADSRKWLREGWVDYLAPQLYWGNEPPETSFTALLRWWAGENVQRRHVWPGLDLGRVGPGRSPEEIVAQVRLTRGQPGTSGNIHWGVRALTENRRGLSDALLKDVYGQPALTPVFSWLDSQPPAAPQISATCGTGEEVTLRCKATGAEPTWHWLVQTRSGARWTSQVLRVAPSETVLILSSRPDVIAVTAVDRCGNASEPSVIEKRLVAEARNSP